MEILAVKNLSFSYPLKADSHSEKKALENLSFSVEKGDFTVICGATGSGKTTLLRMLKRELTPLGEKSGTVEYYGTPLEDLDEKTAACKIGFVMQRPEQQLVTDKVWHELAFGLENMGLPQQMIRRRVAEMSSYFGIEDWFGQDVSELSGGQKQLLNLAAVMVMQPDVLILDEPTAQLDPIAASDFIGTLQKLNRELSLTIILVEHRLEDVIPVCDKLLVLEKGKILDYGTARKVAENMRAYPAILEAMPAAVRLYHQLDVVSPCPLTVREGRRLIEEHFDHKIKAKEQGEYGHKEDPALEFSDVWFRYARELPDVLHGLDFTVYSGELFCILGGNGSGKTTALGAAAGLNRFYAGNVKVFGKKLKEYINQSLYRDCLALLPQDVQTVFLRNTVKEELAEVGGDEIELPYDLAPLMNQHPYDLSGGEQQLVALAKVLATKPKLLLLDEPTKGLDAYAKNGIIKVLKKLQASGVTIVAVTHDVEFAAQCADRCALFFQGEITSIDTPAKFFAENTFYTTAANRMTRGYYDGVVTVDDAVSLCLQNGRKT
ncbi:MAG TPA: ATP-binding cassette domain-containing protein [Oscillospiraceae bacterium]|nr:ATP-binding cassette domain-containing protein [Oscillospiraceae bacterium]HPF55201.1 ATP-binding cassette domain-containing protein [Clostridiales bacterium]HPK36415.1 ATP-binding cassette domain-containing protein [Oscillospiraceae bacterium]HPR75719.1 ATP-binding cassette domain-containing protein [Oscillospiraceae bacterium]